MHAPFHFASGVSKLGVRGDHAGEGGGDGHQLFVLVLCEYGGGDRCGQQQYFHCYMKERIDGNAPTVVGDCRSQTLFDIVRRLDGRVVVVECRRERQGKLHMPRHRPHENSLNRTI